MFLPNDAWNDGVNVAQTGDAEIVRAIVKREAKGVDLSLTDVGSMGYCRVPHSHIRSDIIFSLMEDRILGLILFIFWDSMTFTSNFAIIVGIGIRENLTTGR